MQCNARSSLCRGSWRRSRPSRRRRPQHSSRRGAQRLRRSGGCRASTRQRHCRTGRSAFSSVWGPLLAWQRLQCHSRQFRCKCIRATPWPVGASHTTECVACKQACTLQHAVLPRREQRDLYPTQSAHVPQLPQMLAGQPSGQLPTGAAPGAAPPVASAGVAAPAALPAATAQRQVCFVRLLEFHCNWY